MHTYLVEAIHLFQCYLHQKKLERTTLSIEKAYANQSMDLIPIATETLQDVLKILRTKILESKDMRNPPCSLVATAIRMHLLTRGVFPTTEGPQGERVTLLRWWHIHHQQHPSYHAIFQKFEESIGFNDDYTSRLMVNAPLTRDQWVTVLTYFKQYYEVFIYREQGRFLASDIESVPTDLQAGQAVLFCQPQTIEQTLAFLYANLDVYRNLGVDDPMPFDDFLDDNRRREISAIQEHTASQHEEIARLCDCCLNSSSPWRALWELTGETQCFQSHDVSYTESTLIF